MGRVDVMDCAVSKLKGEPERIQNTAGEWFWTVPDGYKTPQCPGCGHKYWYLKPGLSVGGASVRGPVCEGCERNLDKLL